MSRDGRFEAAVHSCYEAMSLEVEHPSVAFLLYVATIEGIGARSVSLARCKECGMEKGAGERFRAALQMLPESDDTRALARLAYKIRSKTGHEGLLFGSEYTFGYGKISFFQFDDGDLFDYELLWPMRKACRQLVRELVRSAEADAGTGGSVSPPGKRSLAGP
jgi:hypothetical protein